MTRSRKGFSVLLVVVDWITKFVIVEPFRTANAQQMVHFLENYVFLRFSTPRIIVSDSGSQFLSQVFQSFLKRYRVIHMRTAFYTPMCNAAERTNRTLVTCIRSLLDVDQRDWDQHLQQIVCAINTTKHDTLGCSPHYCNFGREHILFTETYPLANLNTLDDPGKAQGLRMEVIKNIQEFVLSRIKKVHETSKQRYNLRARNRVFEIGEIVWRRSFEQSSAIDHRTKKLGPKFLPCIVRQKQGCNNYLLEDIKSGKTGIYHAKDIKED